MAETTPEERKVLSCLFQPSAPDILTPLATMALKRLQIPGHANDEDEMQKVINNLLPLFDKKLPSQEEIKDALANPATFDVMRELLPGQAITPETILAEAKKQGQKFPKTLDAISKAIDVVRDISQGKCQITPDTKLPFHFDHYGIAAPNSRHGPGTNKLPPMV